MDQIINTISTGTRVLHGVNQFANTARNLKREFDEAVGSSGSKKARTSTETGYIINPGGYSSIGKVSTTTPVGYSVLNNPKNVTGIGMSHVASIGNKTGAPVSMRLGKQLGPINSVDNFLSLFTQTGTISNSFGGRLEVNHDTRGRVFHVFRHNLRADSTEEIDTLTTSAAYPSTALLLTPVGSIDAAGKALTNAPIRDLVNGAAYFAPYNKADLEDVSFNLNKFKLGPTSTVQYNTATDESGKATVSMNSGTATTDLTPSIKKIALLNDIAVMQANKHRALSAICQNNIADASFTSATDYKASPYRYEAVLKQGVVNYMFMNKGLGALIVEVVVYRVKRNAAGIPESFSDFNIRKQIETPICRGNLKKYLEGFGTDDLGGTSRGLDDWATDPSVPYLPSCRQIEQGELGYKEVERVKIAMTSGERRPFQLKLGGEKYDPANVMWRGLNDTSKLPEDPSIVDKHSYIVALVVNGVPMTRDITTSSNGDYIGDTFASADFQYTGVYIETVGAMSYKKCQSKPLYTNGYGGSMNDAIKAWNTDNPTAKLSTSPVVLVTQDNAVRTGNHTHGGLSATP